MTAPTCSCGTKIVRLTIGSRISSIRAGSPHLVHHRRRGGDQIHVVLALEPLLHDVHVQQAQEAAPEAEAQGLAHLGLEVQRGVVQLQLGEGVAQRLVLVALDRKKTGKHLRLDFLEARQRAGCRPALVGHRVTDASVAQLLDAADDESHLARGEPIAAARLGCEHADLLHQVGRTGGHQQDLVLRLDDAVDHPHQHHHADVVVEPGVDHERLQRRLGAAPGRRHASDDALEDLVDAHAGLGAGQHGVVGVDADDVLDLLPGTVRIGLRQVHLVQHRQHFYAELDGRVAVGHRLRLHALRGVDHQQRALAGGQRSAHLVAEVHVPRGVDQIKVVALPVGAHVLQRGGLGFDGDAALALQVHRIEDLRLHLAVGQAAATLDQAVGERRLAVVDVGDDREVTDVLHRSADRARARRIGTPPGSTSRDS